MNALPLSPRGASGPGSSSAGVTTPPLPRSSPLSSSRRHPQTQTSSPSSVRAPGSGESPIVGVISTSTTPCPQTASSTEQPSTPTKLLMPTLQPHAPATASTTPSSAHNNASNISNISNSNSNSSHGTHVATTTTSAKGSVPGTPSVSRRPSINSGSNHNNVRPPPSLTNPGHRQFSSAASVSSIASGSVAGGGAMNPMMMMKTPSAVHANTNSSMMSSTHSSSDSLLHTNLYRLDPSESLTKAQPDEVDVTKFQALLLELNQTQLPKPRPPSECPLFCVFYAEFDNVVGPIVRTHSPPSFMDSDISLTTDQVHKHLSRAFSETDMKISAQCSSTKSTQKAEESKVPSKSDDSLNADSEKEDPPKGENSSQSEGNTTSTYDDETVRAPLPFMSSKRMLGDSTDTDTSHSTNIRTRRTQHSNHTSTESFGPAGEGSLSTSQHNSTNNSLSIFDSTSEYIITGNELADRMICLSTHNMHILTRPSIIHDSRYERNSLLFSVGFVLRRAEDPRPFRPMLSKLASTLRTMEVESQFLSQQQHSQSPATASTGTETSAMSLQSILEGILVSLNSPQAECNLLLNDANALNLKLFKPPRPVAGPVPDHVVPVLLRPTEQIQMFDWDLTINWVVPHINGISHARNISQSLEVDMEMVRACLRVLKHHGVLAFVDIFQYSNRYECTDLAANMMAGNLPKLLNAAFHFAAKNPPTKDAYQERGHPSHANNSEATSQSTSSRNSLKEFSMPETPSGTLSMNSYIPIGKLGSNTVAKADPIDVQLGKGERQVPIRGSPITTMISSSYHEPRQMSVIPPASLSAFSYPPPQQVTIPDPFKNEKSSDGSIAAGRRDEHRRLEHRRSMKAALVQLYCACHRDTTFGEILLEKLNTSQTTPPPGAPPFTKRHSSDGGSGSSADDEATPSSGLLFTTPEYGPIAQPPGGDSFPSLNSSSGGGGKARHAYNQNPDISFTLSPTVEEETGDTNSPVISPSKNNSVGSSTTESDRAHSGFPENDTGGSYPDAANVSTSQWNTHRQYRREQIQQKVRGKGPAVIDWTGVLDYFDHRRLITFGVIHGLIRRVHEYPYVYDQEPDENNEDDSMTNEYPIDSMDATGVDLAPVTTAENPEAAVVSPERRTKKERERRILLKQAVLAMDGSRCDDELSCMFQRPYTKLVDLVTADGTKGVVSLYTTSSEQP